MSSPDTPSDDGGTSAADLPDVPADAPNDAIADATDDEATEAAGDAPEVPDMSVDLEPAGIAGGQFPIVDDIDLDAGDDEQVGDDHQAGERELVAVGVVAAPANPSGETPMVVVRHGKDTAPKQRHRSWAQRALLGLNCVVILACFAGAIGLLLGRHYGNSIARVDLETPPNASQPSGAPSATDENGSPVDTVPVDTTPTDTGPVETFPTVDPGAKNFLITGADNNACIDPDSPYAAAFGDRETMGERSDTIMLMRVDPDTRRAAVLSFPRDLWVKIDGRSSKSRINAAYVRDEPQKLINTIYANFGLGVDHFIQVDFCAFKTIVDALDGVTVPFDYPARDTHTGLYVPEAVCFTFDGDHALAYVRSRYYQKFEDGKWVSDPASDLGRISRQQDFLRRVLSSALAKGLNPAVARDIIKAAQDYVVLDKDLTITRMLEFAGILSSFEPGAIATYQIESYSDTIGGNAVLVPRINGDNMQAILAIFRGEAPLAGAPEQVFDSTTTSSDPDADPTSSGPDTTTTTVTGPEQDVIGIVPPDRSC